VKVLFENLEAGMSIEEVIEQFPVTREQLDSLMAFVARSLEKVPSHFLHLIFILLLAAPSVVLAD
jgi:hypothetical protein